MQLSFGGIRALNDVPFTAKRGEVTAIACEFTGEVIGAGAGYLARVQVVEGQGVHLAPGGGGAGSGGGAVGKNCRHERRATV